MAADHTSLKNNIPITTLSLIAASFFPQSHAEAQDFQRNLQNQNLVVRDIRDQAIREQKKSFSLFEARVKNLFNHDAAMQASKGNGKDLTCELKRIDGHLVIAENELELFLLVLEEKVQEHFPDLKINHPKGQFNTIDKIHNLCSCLSSQLKDAGCFVYPLISTENSMAKIQLQFFNAQPTGQFDIDNLLKRFTSQGIRFPKTLLDQAEIPNSVDIYHVNSATIAPSVLNGGFENYSGMVFTLSDSGESILMIFPENIAKLPIAKKIGVHSATKSALYNEAAHILFNALIPSKEHLRKFIDILLPDGSNIKQCNYHLINEAFSDLSSIPVAKSSEVNRILTSPMPGYILTRRLLAKASREANKIDDRFPAFEALPFTIDMQAADSSVPIDLFNDTRILTNLLDTDAQAEELFYKITFREYSLAINQCFDDYARYLSKRPSCEVMLAHADLSNELCELMNVVSTEFGKKYDDISDGLTVNNLELSAINHTVAAQIRKTLDPNFMLNKKLSPLQNFEIILIPKLNSFLCIHNMGISPYLLSSKKNSHQILLHLYSSNGEDNVIPISKPQLLKDLGFADVGYREISVVFAQARASLHNTSQQGNGLLFTSGSAATAQDAETIYIDNYSTQTLAAAVNHHNPENPLDVNSLHEADLRCHVLLSEMNHFFPPSRFNKDGRISNGVLDLTYNELRTLLQYHARFYDISDNDLCFKATAQVLDFELSHFKPLQKIIIRTLRNTLKSNIGFSQEIQEELSSGKKLSRTSRLNITKHLQENPKLAENIAFSFRRDLKRLIFSFHPIDTQTEQDIVIHN